jgi:hypothetical protein
MLSLSHSFTVEIETVSKKVQLLFCIKVADCLSVFIEFIYGLFKSAVKLSSIGL